MFYVFVLKLWIHYNISKPLGSSTGATIKSCSIMSKSVYEETSCALLFLYFFVLLDIIMEGHSLCLCSMAYW